MKVRVTEHVTRLLLRFIVIYRFICSHCIKHCTSSSVQFLKPGSYTVYYVSNDKFGSLLWLGLSLGLYSHLTSWCISSKRIGSHTSVPLEKGCHARLLMSVFGGICFQAEHLLWIIFPVSVQTWSHVALVCLTGMFGVHSNAPGM